ncbi:hypothetical protein TRIATDRAFT_139368 [Trichoderma atroviride IMI 206040]|uniref:Zn(2)-C6 fungal-type domain-containing protein n=2 Tax=Hypocrea atroviridis TaxID=63577 RepID=G9NVD3_HYPAI|nr:uncharacterized protein TRIATDRAFT_139368 [Trichoderma atroviride IMI 206040]EHK44954.1 hypothetical protein TRIATDRAFT_139368 [Trichoderma atroviride IMI 206040]
MVVAACTACRKQKAKCSGERPSCRRCIQRRIECQWTTKPGETSAQALKRGYQDIRNYKSPHEELFELIGTLSDGEAPHVFRIIRSGADITTILNHIKVGNVLVQMAVVPETRLRYVLPYRSEMPAAFIINNPYMESKIYEAASLYSNPSQFTAFNHGDSLDSDEYQNLYVKPFHSAEMIDAPLANAKPSLWTAVCKDDVLMRDILSVWFRCEHHLTSAVQKDYFLEDMVAKQKDFCSSLLVNIVLAYSCVCYQKFADRAEYWNPKTLGYAFAAEAKRLWELESAIPRLTTIQASMIFNVFYNICGLDEIGKSYRIHAIELAEEIRLFDSPLDEQTEDPRTIRLQKGKEFLAWSLFNWETLSSFSFMTPPRLKKPPIYPLPNPSEDALWYGEVWLKYPLSRSLIPSNFGQMYKAKSQLRVIMNEYCQTAYIEKQESQMTLDIADELLRKLKNWFRGLPASLLPKTIALPGQLQLHMHYHHLVLAIFEPLLQISTGQELRIRELIADAKKYLQTLVRLYYIRHGYDSMDLFIIIPLMLIASDCVEAVNDQTPTDQLELLRSTLILAATGLYNQRRNHYLAEALFRVVYGRMRRPEIALLKDSMKMDEREWDERQGMAQAVRSHWPVSIVRKKEDRDANVLANLVKNYAHLNVEKGSKEGE